jgi:ATPase subunit of ABC transporter with duplicated ATPase domains
MIELNVHNITKFYGANKIFHQISFEVKTGERIGFIGQNGCGKTTMMKIIMGLEDYQEGEIHIRKDAKIGYLNQIPIYEDSTTTLDVIRSAFENVQLIIMQMKHYEEQLGFLTGNELDKALVQYSKLSEQYDLSGGYEIETRMNKITEGLHINDSMKDMLFDQLSGGEKTRVILAKILLEEPDILLLDEPTNHLDLSSIEWLEGFLKDYKGSVLVISHDRFFLDLVVGKIIEMEFDSAEVYLGNYSYYMVEKERRFLLEYKNYQNQQKKIDRMERQIERYRIWGEMRDSDKMFRRAKELEKRLDKIDVLDKPILQKRKIRLNQNSAARTGKIVLELQDICKGFTAKNLVQNVNFSIFYQDSTCLIGKNGCGKTTLLRLILGELEPDHGIIKLGAQVKIGYLPQNVIYPDEELTILEYFTRLHNITNGEARSILAKVLFVKDDINKKIKSLSGGEKSRLRLCSLTFEGVNFMILDEPTNHLDIDSREVLEETLTDFDGTLLFVSHDRYFINKVADKIITLENGEVKIYPGDYTYYLEESQKEMTNQTLPKVREKEKNDKRTETNTASEKSSHQTLGKRPSSSGDLIKLKQIEGEIETMENEIRQLEEEMSRNNTDAEYLKELFHKKEELEQKLELLYVDWELYATK